MYIHNILSLLKQICILLVIPPLQLFSSFAFSVYCHLESYRYYFVSVCTYIFVSVFVNGVGVSPFLHIMDSVYLKYTG